MFFLSKRLPMDSLIDLCRSMRYSLASGLLLRDVMDLLASKGTKPVRPVAAKISQDLKAGWDLQEALKKQQASFPPLFMALAAVGEESGNLPEVLGEMEKYYLLQQKLRREFRSQIRWPMFQLVAGILVIAGLIYVLGEVIPRKGGRDAQVLDPLGVGLIGADGAMKFLAIMFGGAFILWATWKLLRWLLQKRATVDRFLLRLPAVGPCLQAMALTRFSIALQLMLETNLSVLRTMRLAFMATDNAAYVAAYPRVDAALRAGNNIATSLGSAGVFPEKFLSAMAVAEESGHMPEVLRHQADEYDEETRRRLATLNQIAGWLVWLGVAILMITAIIRVFSTMYFENIEHMLDQTGK
jgi:type II secretory pathway component PulF